MNKNFTELYNALSSSRFGGYVTQSSLRGSSILKLLTVLEPLQDSFFEKYKLRIPSEYASKWPVDKLHWWSRPQEYSFILFNLLKTLNEKKSNLRILEFGPGCSFVPHALNALTGLNHLYIEEIDDQVVNFWKDIGKTFNLQVERSKSSSPRRDFFDIIYSISVVEHVGRPAETVRKLIEQLVPGGQLILTLDIDLSNNGHYGLTSEQLQEILLIEEIDFDSLPALSGCPHIYDIATPKDGWRIPNGNDLGYFHRQPRKKSTIYRLKDIFRRIASSKPESSDICVLKLMGFKKYLT